MDRVQNYRNVKYASNPLQYSPAYYRVSSNKSYVQAVNAKPDLASTTFSNNLINQLTGSRSGALASSDFNTGRLVIRGTI